jgi:type VI secretion system protein ImpJ
MLRLAGELSTFTQSRRRPDLPAYRHDDLQSVLLPLMQFLRQALSVVIERNAISLPLQERGYGVSTATIADRTLLQGSRFILVVTASVPAEQVRVQFPNQVKIGSVEQIRDLVNLQLPGIPIRALSVAPREIPLLQNATYFELDQSHELWRPLVRSAAFAFHVSGDYSDLHLEFWAVRGKSV